MISAWSSTGRPSREGCGAVGDEPRPAAVSLLCSVSLPLVHPVLSIRMEEESFSMMNNVRSESFQGMSAKIETSKPVKEAEGGNDAAARTAPQV